MLEAVELLQGYEAPAGEWEAAILPARVTGYDPEQLDRLCLVGEVVWGRLSLRGGAPEMALPVGRPPLTRGARITIARREDLAWLLERGPQPDPGSLSPPAAGVLTALSRLGASFTTDLAAACGLGRGEVDAALGELATAGHVTADGFTPLRRGKRQRRDDSNPGSVSRFTRLAPGTRAAGRWWILDRATPEPSDAAVARAAQLVRRYGVLFRDLLARETAAPPWRELLPWLRRAEARGEIRGGRFVAGPTGEQFALAEAVDRLRATRRSEAPGALAVVSACDPLNLSGILTPGPRVPAVAGSRVALRDGLPVASLSRGKAPEPLFEDVSMDLIGALAAAGQGGR